MPRASDIAKTLNTDATSPLDFILKNVTDQSVTVPPPAQPNQSAVVTQAPQASQVTPQSPVEAKPQGNSSDPMPTFGEKLEEKTPEAAPVEEEQDEIDQISDDPIKENYIKLRTKAKEATKTAKELQTQKAEVEKELEKYRTGEIVPDILKEQADKIAHLSKFEKLHNLKASDEYRERFVEPLSRNTDKLRQIFTDYGVAPEELDAAINHTLSLDNKAQLNAFLSENFDRRGADQVEDIVLATRTLQQEAHAAESEPTKVYEQLQQEAQVARTAQNQQRVDKISEVARDSWVESLMDIRTEGKLTELIRKDTDPAFNQKFVDPILQHSAQEYGRLVTELAKNGLTEMSKDLAKGLANMVLRATAQGVAFEARDAALAHMEELQSTASRVNQLFRPQVGGGVPSGRPAPQAQVAMTPAMAAAELVNSVLLKRQ